MNQAAPKMEVELYQGETALEIFPAMVVVKREPQWVHGLGGMRHKIRAGESLACKIRGQWHQFKPSSVVSYALEYNECPLAAVESAKAKGHELYWLTPCAVAVTAWRKPQAKWIAIEVGQVVYFQGRLFEIVKQPNDNLGLVELLADYVPKEG